jgi:hypothetical protein
VKVAICTPVYHDPSYHYTVSLAELLTVSVSTQVNIGYFTSRGSLVAVRRNIIAELALRRGADWLLWIDADQKFPPDTLKRLLSHGLDFVGCNIPIRYDPIGPSAGNIGADGKVRRIWTEPDNKGLEPVDVMGMGVCLIHRRVFEAVEAPWFRGAAEDHLFCARAGQAGFRPHVDHALSWEIGHVSERLLTNQDALDDRERWIEKAGF